MFNKRILSLKETGLHRTLRTVESVQGVRAVVDGKPCTLFCTNDYLGLAGHPDVRTAAKNAIDNMSAGAGSAPLISGHTSYHKKLEDEIAAFKGAESALLFGSGYLANTGIIPALAGEGDAIFSDSLNHASIVDGCRLSKAEVKIYGHAAPSSLEALLKESSGYKSRFIVTEGVFSMDGDIALMPDIMELAKCYGAQVILDEAHATGTIGETGHGTLEHFGLPVDDVIQMGTLGKALGSYGAFVAASGEVTDWLTNSARSFMFSTALPPSTCAAASASLNVITNEPGRLSQLRENSDLLRTSLLEAGFKVLGAGTPIIPVLVGDAGKASRLASSLLEAGFYAPAIRPPTVPAGMSRIRLTMSALHAKEDIEGLALIFSRQNP